MNAFLEAICHLVATGDFKISEHGYDELADDNLSVREVLAGMTQAQVIEEYPDYPKGSCILLLQTDEGGKPVHVMWGIPKGNTRPAVLITAYRPAPDRWDETFSRRLR